jgi:hypothetical protein
MEDEEQRRRLSPVGGFERQIGFDLVQKDGDHLDAPSRCGLQRRLWQTLSVR